MRHGFLKKRILRIRHWDSRSPIIIIWRHLIVNFESNRFLFSSKNRNKSETGQIKKRESNMSCQCCWRLPPHVFQRNILPLIASRTHCLLFIVSTHCHTATQTRIRWNNTADFRMLSCTISILSFVSFHVFRTETQWVYFLCWGYTWANTLIGVIHLAVSEICNTSYRLYHNLAYFSFVAHKHSNTLF